MTSRLLVCLVLIGSRIVVCQFAAQGSEKSTLATAVHRTVAIIKANDVQAFSQIVAKSGVQMAVTQIIRPRHKDQFSDTVVTIPEDQSTSWHMRVENFSGSQLRSHNFKHLFQQFARLIHDSPYNAPTFSLNLHSIRERKYLGPAAEGKICAGEMWTANFVKEGHQWKVWRLEYAF